MILDINGTPVAPLEIVTRLQQINPRLGLKFAQLWGQESSWWAITMRWAENDPRRAYIQRGELPEDEDHDIFGWLPLDCSVDDAYGYIVSSFRKGGKQETRDLLDRVHEYNRQHQQQIWKETTEPVLDDLVHRAGQLAAPTVGPSAKPRKRGKTAKEIRRD